MVPNYLDKSLVTEINQLGTPAGQSLRMMFRLDVSQINALRQPLRVEIVQGFRRTYYYSDGAASWTWNQSGCSMQLAYRMVNGDVGATTKITRTPMIKPTRNPRAMRFGDFIELAPTPHTR